MIGKFREQLESPLLLRKNRKAKALEVA